MGGHWWPFPKKHPCKLPRNFQTGEAFWTRKVAVQMRERLLSDRITTATISRRETKARLRASVAETIQFSVNSKCANELENKIKDWLMIRNSIVKMWRDLENRSGRFHRYSTNLNRIVIHQRLEQETRRNILWSSCNIVPPYDNLELCYVKN